jgi:hypothetical protein
MDFHVITPREQQLVMQTCNGQVVKVLPAPPSSLPVDAAPVLPPQGKCMG